MPLDRRDAKRPAINTRGPASGGKQGGRTSDEESPVHSEGVLSFMMPSRP